MKGNAGRVVYVLCLIVVISVSAYPKDRSFEESLQDAYDGYLSDQDARDLQGLFDPDEDVDDPYLSDLKQDIISRLLEDQENYGAAEEELEPIDEIDDDQTERGLSEFDMEPLMDDSSKYDFDESEFSDFDSRFHQPENVNDFDDVNDEEETEFARGNFADDMTADNFDEDMMPGFEEKEYMRNANEDWSDDRFSDFNDNYMRGNGYGGIEQVDDLSEDDVNENADFGQEYMRANDWDEDEMANFEGQDFERMTDTDDEFANDNDMRGQEDMAGDIDGGDDDPDDEDLNDTDREILREMVEEILKKKLDGEDDLDAEKELEEKFSGL